MTDDAFVKIIKCAEALKSCADSIIQGAQERNAETVAVWIINASLEFDEISDIFRTSYTSDDPSTQAVKGGV